MIGHRSRRALLRTGALAVGSLAGCVGSLGDANDDGPSATRTTTRNGPPTTNRDGPRTTGRNGTRTAGESPTTARPAVELVPVGVQSSFFYRATPDSVDVEAVEGVQFAFVEVRPRTASPPPSDFALVADGRRYWGTLAPGDAGGPNRLAELGSGYRYENADPGWVAFEVPDPLDAEEVAVARDGRRWSVGADLLASLRTPSADFELASFDTPDEVAVDGAVEASFAVENVGGTDGTFRASVSPAGPTYPSHRTAVPVAAGERRQRTVRIGVRPNAETERVDLRFRSAVADREATVEVVGGPSAE